MALRATRPGTIQGVAIQAEVVEAEVVRPVPMQAPAVVRPNLPAQPAGKISDLNAGILEGMEGLGESAFIKVDGESFVIPDGSDTGLRTREIRAIISYGKRFYQWVDERDPNNKVFHDSDTKLNEDYKLKFLLKFGVTMDDTDDADAKEVQLSLSTTSAINFIEYVKKLAKAGYGVGNVVTQFSISRQTRQGTKDKYSRVEFEGYTLDTGVKICGTV